MTSPHDEVTPIGDRRELMADDSLIDQLDDVILTLHRPIPKEVVLVHDRPWEGNVCFYHTVVYNSGKYQMYYRGAHYDDSGDKAIGAQVVCYAESDDGISWNKPDLGLISFDGSTSNNIIWDVEPESHNFSPFLDANPNCPPDLRYKALGGGSKGLRAFKSSDGIHWSLLQEDFVITEGAFDSQNLAFWDTNTQQYRSYFRDFKIHNGVRIRDIMTSTSADFLNWSAPEWLEYGGAPTEHLYTNQVTPYFRAPHFYMGFPKRFVPERNPFGHQHTGVSDVVFMCGRDGVHFHRWGEALIRPGLQAERWENRNNFVAHGIVESPSGIPGTPDELALYSMEGYYRGGSCQMRRYAVRPDGFVSARAALSGGYLTTAPISFTGNHLSLNMSTSAAGRVSVEIQSAHRKPLEGFTIADCDDIYGDDLEREITWNGSGDLSNLSGTPVRLRIRLSDADLYSYRFFEA